jgi:hypothetical protein
MNTSLLPLSSDPKANQRPSGDNCPNPSHALVATTAEGGPPVSGILKMSARWPPPPSPRMRVPSIEAPHGKDWLPLEMWTSRASPPLAAFSWIVDLGLNVE